MAVEVNGMGVPPRDPRKEQKDLRDEDHDIDADHEVDDITSSKPKKKRRVVKTADKKYECPHPECGKSYSRAEHLYRHQLNHTPKQIYHCDFPGCDRNFVRADLCARHKERHTAKGSHLQRKDAFLNNQRTVPVPSSSESTPSTGTMNVSPAAANHVFQATSDPYTTMPTPMRQYSSSSADMRPSMATNLTPINTANGLHLDPQLGPYSAYTATMTGPPQPEMPQSAPADDRRFAYDGAFPTRLVPQMGAYNHNIAMSSMQVPMSSPQPGGPIYTTQAYPSPTSSSQNFRSPSSLSTLPSLPPFNYAQNYGPTSSSRSGSMMSPPTISSADQQPVPNSRATSSLDFNVFDGTPTSFAMPVFGSDTPLVRSPLPVMDETFLSMLFNSNGMELSDPTPSEPDVLQPMPESIGVPLPKVELDGPISDHYLPSLSDGFDIDIPQSNISEKKQERLFDYIQNLGEIEHNPGRKTKAEMLAGDPKDPNHVLSLRMIKTYITSYWVHIHQQMPILHRPTFNPETCPDALLLSMMCLGATCLERTHTLEMTQASAELAFFISYHIRWEVFKDAEFRPAAKLWTFQSMLLLELFEKMFSTRALHERGHVHHATTITVMRRGSSLIGRSAIESPGRGLDPTRTPPGPDGSINTSGQNTPDAYWNRWITAEATRRAAFAAFIFDATHAILFGHSAVMSPHELRLPLPCDEALWSATSSAEVQRVEASLAVNGFKTPSFLEGLRRTLNGQKVRTNTFGRTILMAGLLNVSWHMNQRDLQVNSIGANTTLGSQIRWRSPLTRAFDFWRRDFDESMSKNDHWLVGCHPKIGDPCPLDHREIVFESRTCLHSLAHMAMHVDMVDCQVFAGAERAVGRMVTDADRATVQRRMREQWAPSARARDAVFYALRFLYEVMIPDGEVDSKSAHPPPQQISFTYSPRHDYLLNRPWVLYFATLIVWSYGYALDGPIKPSTYTLISRESQVYDMQQYIIRMGSVTSPDDLENMSDRNACLGLLLLLRAKFEEPRWELMHEAAAALGSCIEMLVPGYVAETRQRA